MNTDSLSFSIILCTFERTADLVATLDSIRQTQIPSGATGELIVVDSSRNDDTRRTLNHDFPVIPGLPLQVLHEPRRGKAHALNTGIEAARGEILLFTDDDIRVPSQWIEPMIHPILNGMADAVAGGIHLAPKLRRNWMQELHRSWMADTSVLNQRTPEVLVGANMAFSRQVLAKVPLFDTELGSGTALGGCDESLFSLQLLAAGFRIAGAFEASVEHHFDPSRLDRRSFRQRARIEGRSSAYIAHHWRHENVSHPYREMLLPAIKLLARRWILRSPWNGSEGAPLWELAYLLRLNFLWQYICERRMPRKYGKFGLVKQAN